MFCKNIRNREKEVNQDVERYTKDDILLSSADKFFYLFGGALSHSWARARQLRCSATQRDVKDHLNMKATLQLLSSLFYVTPQC